MKIVLGKFFRFLNVFFYFSPILFANYRWRKYLKVLYQRENERLKRKGLNVDAPKTVVYMALSETTFSGGQSDHLRRIVGIQNDRKKMC